MQNQLMGAVQVSIIYKSLVKRKFINGQVTTLDGLLKEENKSFWKILLYYFDTFSYSKCKNLPSN